MGAFSKLKEAQATGSRANYIEPGNHVLEVRSMELKKAEAAENDWYITEFNVKDSDTWRNEEKTQKTPAAAVWNMDNRSSPGNIKNLLQALDPDVQDDDLEEAAENATSSEQPATGAVIVAEAVMTTTKAGKPFTRVVYRPLTVEDWEKLSDEVKEEITRPTETEES